MLISSRSSITTIGLLILEVNVEHFFDGSELLNSLKSSVGWCLIDTNSHQGVSAGAITRYCHEGNIAAFRTKFGTDSADHARLIDLST